MYHSNQTTNKVALKTDHHFDTCKTSSLREDELTRRQTKCEMIGALRQQRLARLARRQFDIVSPDQLCSKSAKLGIRHVLPNAVIWSERERLEGVLVLDEIRPRAPSLRNELLGLRVD